MKRTLLLLAPLFALVLMGSAQAQAPASIDTAASSPDRAPIEATLKSYVAAYERRNIEELVAIWPDLQNQKKDYKKIKQHFDDSHISNLKVTLAPQEIQTSKDDAIARCDRTEEYVKTVSHSDGSGDTMMANVAQRPPPSERTSTSNEKKKDTLWFKLHKNGDNWQIVQVSDKQLAL
jgi:hypothetical protein